MPTRWRIPCDPANPAQVWAGLGLLVWGSLLVPHEIWRGEHREENNESWFVITTAVKEGLDPQLLTFLADSDVALRSEPRWEGDNEGPQWLRFQFGDRPISFPLAAWLRPTARPNKKDFERTVKGWAGNAPVTTLLPQILALLQATKQNAAPECAESQISWPHLWSVNADDKQPPSKTLGFSPNAAWSIDSSGYSLKLARESNPANASPIPISPWLEFFALLGAEFVLPLPSPDGSSGYVYHTWTDPLPLEAARLAICGISRGWRLNAAYQFSQTSRGKYKSWNYAVPTSFHFDKEDALDA